MGCGVRSVPARKVSDTKQALAVRGLSPAREVSDTKGAVSVAAGAAVRKVSDTESVRGLTPRRCKGSV
jgi:hypothetical protein